VSRRLAGILPWIAVGALVATCFARLVARPGDLLVDGECPSIDAALQPDARSLGNDLTRLFLPHHARIAEQVARGRLPSAWDPVGFGGRPRVGNPQAGLFYPPVWLVWLARTPSSLTWLTVAHLLWGGFGILQLARRFGTGPIGASVSALTFVGSPYILAQVFEGHYPHVWSASWYPWAFLAADRLRRGDRLGAPWLSLVLAFAFLTGHPQEVYYLVLVLSAWVLGDAVRRQRSGMFTTSISWSRLAGRFTLWGLVLVLMAGFVAVELAPSAMAAAWGLRSTNTSMLEASRYHVGLLNILQLLSPNALGGPSEYFGYENYWECLLSFGWTPVVLATLGMCVSLRRAQARAWGALLGLTLMFAAGWRLGLFAALYELVPGMNRFRVPARALFLSSLAVAMLAGLGVDSIVRAEPWERWWVRYRRWVVVVVGAVIVAQSVAWCRGVDGDPYAHLPPSIPLVFRAQPSRDSEAIRYLRAGARLAQSPSFWLTVAGTSGALLWLRRRPEAVRSVALVFGVLVFTELGWHGFRVLKTAPLDRFVGPDPVAQAIAEARPSPETRIRVRDAFYTDLRAQAAGLEKVNIYDFFQIQHSDDLYGQLYNLFRYTRPQWSRQSMSGPVEDFRREVRQAVLDRMGVEFLVTDLPTEGDPWPVIARGTWRGSAYIIYRNRSALPRAYVVPRAEILPDERSSVYRLRAISGREAVVMSSDPLDSVGERQRFTAAHYDATDPDCVVISVTTQAPGLLVVADTWMPGWSARIDGRPSPVWKGNRGQRVLALRQPGQHRVVMCFTPPGFALGLGITSATAVTWLGSVLLVLRCRRMRRRAVALRLRDARSGRRDLQRTALGVSRPDDACTDPVFATPRFPDPATAHFEELTVPWE
jgi:hypothetical protein